MMTKNKFLKIIGLILLNVLLGLPSLSAQSFFSAIADPVPAAYTARQMALGFSGWGLAGQPAASMSNPALLTENQFRILVTGQFRGLSVNEKRSFPVQDSFGDFLADNTYVINQNWFPAASLGILYRPWRSLNLALNWMPLQSHYFDYEEEVRGSVFGQYNRDPLVGYYRIWDRGNLNLISFGAGYRPLRSLALGFGVHWLMPGTIEQLWEVEVVQPSDNLMLDASARGQKESEVQSTIFVNFGATYQLTKHLQLGLAYRSAYRVELQDALLLFTLTNETLPVLVNPMVFVIAEMLTDIDEKQATLTPYPQQLRLGVTLQPTNIIPTKVFVELVYDTWEDVQLTNTYSTAYSGGQAEPYEVEEVFHFNNTLKIHLAVEHKLFSGIDFRMGFLFNPSPIDASLNRNWFTVGAGYRYQQLGLDFAGAFTNGEYKYPDLFPITGEKRLAYDTVQESFLTAMLSLNYFF